jgi:hypothetical protein
MIFPAWFYCLRTAWRRSTPVYNVLLSGNFEGRGYFYYVQERLSSAKQSTTAFADKSRPRKT